MIGTDTDAGTDAGRASGPNSSADAVRRAIRGGLASTGGAIRRALPRPTASEVTVAGLTLAVGFAIGTTLLRPEVTVPAVVAGLATALATVLLASGRPIVRGVGGALVVPVAVLAVAPVALAWALVLASAGVPTVAGVTVWVLVIAGLAAGLVSWDRLGRGGVHRASRGTFLAGVGVAAVALVRIAPEADARDQLAETTVAATGSGADVLVYEAGDWALVSFGVLLALAALTARWAVGYLPLERLVPPDRRRTVSAVVARIRRACSIALRVAIATLVAAFAAPAALEPFEGTPLPPSELRTEAPEPLGDLLAAVATSPTLRLLALGLVAVSLALAGLERLRRLLGTDFAAVVAGIVAPAVGAGLAAVVVAAALAEPAVDAVLEPSVAESLPGPLAELLATVPPFVLAAFVLVAALGSLSSLLYSITALRVVRILPGRAAGAALASGSIFCLAIGLVIVGRLETAVWTGAAALVCWDVGEYGDGVRRELGRGAGTIRAELVHVGGSLLTGGVVAGGTIVLYRRLLAGADVPVVDPALAAVAVMAGLLAVVLVAWGLRG
ncbi:hypothetical protein ACFQGT_19670 [Natrialbaceae archaeon GCM10025810]|uniref:DUF7519 family protein n=1 Tax=Halovalidus salilacus TaxID=3075124 RepID=UPI00360E76E8